jgi:predicted RNA-binding protein YlqC (UPF0109 family)
MKTLLETLVKEMVTEPDSVTIDAAESSKSAVYDISAAKKDMGRVIGRKGKNLEALKTLFEAIGLNRGLNSVVININDE